MARSLTRVLAFTPAPTSPLVADLANRAPPRQRGAVRAEVTSELQLYRQLARRHGFAPNMLSSNTLYAIEMAYPSYNGDAFSNAAERVAS